MDTFWIDTVGDRERALAQQLQVRLACLAARDAMNTPLRCSEMMVNVPREDLKQLMELALEELRRRHKQRTYQG